MPRKSKHPAGASNTRYSKAKLIQNEVTYIIALNSGCSWFDKFLYISWPLWRFMATVSENTPGLLSKGIDNTPLRTLSCANPQIRRPDPSILSPARSVSKVRETPPRPVGRGRRPEIQGWADMNPIPRAEGPGRPTLCGHENDTTPGVYASLKQPPRHS